MSLCAFDIGWVPKGWTRGEELDVSPAARMPNGDHRVGYVAQAELPPYPGLRAASGAVIVRFTAESTKDVQAWLAWWAATEQ